MDEIYLEINFIERRQIREIKCESKLDIKETIKFISEKTIKKTIKITSDEINKILRADYFAKNTEHIVKIKDLPCIDSYNGTSFIYRQMVFNMIYDKFGDKNSTVKEKINNLIDCMMNSGVPINNIVERITDDDIKILENILVDKITITQNKKKDFLTIIKKIKSKEIILKDEVIIIFILITNVRNNFFHGTKEAQEALEKGQNERLEIYSRFLSKITEEFINLAEKKGIRLDRGSLFNDLKENLGLLRR